MTIKTEPELLADFPDTAVRGTGTEITAQRIRDFIDSVIAVAGTMYGNDQAVSVTAAWQPYEWFEASIDTKGLNEDLTQGHFTVLSGAGGVYAVDVNMGIFSNVAGWAEIAITKNGTLTPYRARRTLTAGGDGVFGIVASGTLADGDTVGLAIRASGSASITVRSAQFRAIRT